MSEPRVVEGAPSTLPMMLKAALPVLPGVNLMPGLRKAGRSLSRPDADTGTTLIDRATSRRTPRCAVLPSRTPCR